MSSRSEPAVVLNESDAWKGLVTAALDICMDYSPAQALTSLDAVRDTIYQSFPETAPAASEAPLWPDAAAWDRHREMLTILRQIRTELREWHGGPKA